MLFSTEVISNVIVEDAPAIMDWQWVLYSTTIPIGVAALVFTIIGLCQFFGDDWYYDYNNKKIGAKFILIAAPTLVLVFVAGFVFLGVYNSATSSWEKRTAELLGPEVSVSQVQEAGVIDAVRAKSVTRLEMPDGYKYSEENDSYAVDDRIFMVDGNVVSVRSADSVPELVTSSSEDKDKSDEEEE